MFYQFQNSIKLFFWSTHLVDSKRSSLQVKKNIRIGSIILDYISNIFKIIKLEC